MNFITVRAVSRFLTVNVQFFGFKLFRSEKCLGKEENSDLLFRGKLLMQGKVIFPILVLNCLLVCSRWVKGYCEILTSVGGFLAVSRGEWAAFRPCLSAN